jgi:sugar phosphate isomerase/epimerase
VPILQALWEVGYRGPLSVEFFNHVSGNPAYPCRDPLVVFSETMRYLRNCMAQLSA